MSLLIFITGAIFGSFFYVVGTRLPNNESLIKPRSHCTNCKHALKFYELIPILSYLVLRGRCHKCKQKISLKYLIYEIFTGTLFLISYLKFNISYEFFISLIISSLVVLIFITDFQYMIILDSPLIVAFVLVFILKWTYFDLDEALFSLVGGILAFITMLLIRQIGNIVFKKESLGGGDIKFFFLPGMILGYKFAIISLVLSTFIALPYAVAMMFLNKDSELPFGPFLVSSLFLVFYFGEKFQYLNYFI